MERHAYRQNGEEDTGLKDDLIKVKKKLLSSFVIAIVSACILFGIIYYFQIHNSEIFQYMVFLYYINNLLR